MAKLANIVEKSHDEPCSHESSNIIHNKLHDKHHMIDHMIFGYILSDDQ